MGKGGKSAAAEAAATAAADQGPSVLAHFQPFLRPDFNAADFTSRVLTGLHTTAQAQAQELRAGVQLLEQELSSQIVARQRELLHNTRKLADTERAVQDVVLSLESLDTAVRRVRAEVVAPHEEVRSKTQQLRNLTATIDLLRLVIQRIKLTNKLRALVSPSPPATAGASAITAGGAAAAAVPLDLPKAATLVHDVMGVGSEAQLQGLVAVANDEEFLRATAACIRDQAQAALTEGMEALSQAKVGSALQVFFNLGELDKAVQGVLTRHLNDIERALKSAIDSRQLGLSSAVAGSGSGATAAPAPGGARGLSNPAPGASGSWQEKLWRNWRELCDLVSSSAVAVWHLQRVVAKKRDPLSHVAFVDVLQRVAPGALTDRFWASVVKLLEDACLQVSRPAKAGFVREALTAGYPKLAALLDGMCTKLTADTTVKGAPPAAGPEQLQQLLAATRPLQNAYLGASLSRMSDAIAAAFSGGGRALPSPADVQKCIMCLHEELKSGSSSPQLATHVASMVGKALLLLCERAELMAATGPDVRALGVSATAAQLRNIALCSQLQEVQRSLVTLLPRLPPGAHTALTGAMEALQATAIDTVLPLFKAVAERLEELLLRMHAQRSFGEEEVSVTETSGYMADVSQTLAHFRAEFLSKFVPLPSPTVPSTLASLVHRLACRLLTFFLRHAALLRPLSHAGKLQLAKDVAELQLTVGQNLYSLDHLGVPYRMLRAFRALLFLDTSAIAANPVTQELPASLVLHHLFSRAPPEVHAPHQRSGLTPVQYSVWLDQHGPEDVARGVRAALEACGPAVRQDAAYLTMVQLCCCTPAAPAAAGRSFHCALSKHA